MLPHQSKRRPKKPNNHRFKRTEVRRVLHVAEAAGYAVHRIDVSPDGKISVVVGPRDTTTPVPSATS